jgi:hypothetical protein
MAYLLQLFKSGHLGWCHTFHSKNVTVILWLELNSSSGVHHLDLWLSEAIFEISIVFGEQRSHP